MGIKVVETEGFKNKERATYNLSGLDMIIGENGSGKSSLLQAIQFALTGKIPGVAEKNQEIIKFCNGSKFNVKVFLEDGIVERAIQIDGDSIKTKVSCPNYMDKGTMSEKNKAILLNTIGSSACLNFSEFLSLKDNEKRKFMYSLLGDIGDYDKEYIRKYILKQKKYELSSSVLEDLLLKYNEECNIEDNLKNMQQHIEDKKKYYNAEYKKIEQSLKQLTTTKNNNNYNMNGLEMLINKRKDIVQNIKEVEKVINQNKQKSQFIKDLQSKSSILANSINILESKINTCKKEDVLKQVIMEEERYKNLEKEILKSDEKISDKKKQIFEIRNKIGEVKVLGIDVRAKMDSTNTILKSITSQNGCCTLDNSIKCNKDFTPNIEIFSNQIKEFKITRESLLKEYKTLEASQVKLEEDVLSLESNKKDLVNTMFKIKDGINTLKLKIKDIEANVNELNYKKEQVKQNQKTISQYVVLDNDMYIKQKNSLENSLESIDEEISKYDELKANEILIQKSKSELNLSKSSLDSYKNLGIILGPKGLQGQIVKSGLGLIKEEINNTLQILNIEGDFFFECTGFKEKEVFNFGMKVGKYKRYFETMSTGEKLLLSIAMLNVIINRLNSKCKVLVIDDIVNLDKDNRRKLYSGVVKLKHSFDNIIIMGAINKEEINRIPKEINIIDQGKLEFNQITQITFDIA